MIDFPNIDAYLYRPVVEGMWKQREAIDGTYTFHDLLVAHEILDVQNANKNLVDEWLRKQHG